MPAGKDSASRSEAVIASGFSRNCSAWDSPDRSCVMPLASAPTSTRVARTKTTGRFATYRDAMVEFGHAFHPHQVGVARAFYVAKDAADKDAALERRMAGTRRMHAISQRPDGKNTASIMAFSDTKESNEEATLFGSPDEICRKIERLHDAGIDYILLNGGGTSRENLRRFAREVMPHFHGDSVRRAAE